MELRNLEERVDSVESDMAPLRELPARAAALESRMANVELQVVQLRDEMRGEFSAIRRDMVTKADLQGFATKDDLRGFPTKDDPKGFATKEDLQALAADLKNQMLVLHEDVIERLRPLGESRARRRPKRS